MHVETLFYFSTILYKKHIKFKHYFFKIFFNYQLKQ